MDAEHLSNVSDGSWATFAETFRKQRETFFFSSLSVKWNALPPILHGGKSRFRIQGTVIQPSEISIGMTAFNLKRSSVG